MLNWVWFMQFREKSCVKSVKTESPLSCQSSVSQVKVQTKFSWRLQLVYYVRGRLVSGVRRPVVGSSSRVSKSVMSSQSNSRELQVKLSIFTINFDIVLIQLTFPAIVGSTAGQSVSSLYSIVTITEATLEGMCCMKCVWSVLDNDGNFDGATGNSTNSAVQQFQPGKWFHCSAGRCDIKL